MKSTNDEKGFTLIEVLVASVITTLIIIVLGNMVTGSFTASRLNNQDSTTFQNANMAMEMMIRDIQNGTDIVCPIGTHSIVIDGTITYLLGPAGFQPTDLVRQDGAENAIVAQNVTSFVPKEDLDHPNVIIIPLEVMFNNTAVRLFQNSAWPRGQMATP